MVFRKKIPARAKRNFRRVAKKMVAYKKRTFKPRRSLQGDTKDFLKITMHRELYKRDFRVNSTDQSMFHDILFNPLVNVSANANGNSTSNLFYHPDLAKLTETLYNKYKITCIVMKFSRPNTTIYYNNTSGNISASHQLPTQPWGTKICHSYLTYNPNATTNVVESNTTLTPRVNCLTPSKWRECVDDGRKQFKSHTYKRQVTRVFRPATNFEKQWRSVSNDDQEICRGLIHIRFEKDHPIDLYNLTSTGGGNYNYKEEAKLLDIEATVYCQYTDRK